MSSLKITSFFTPCDKSKPSKLIDTSNQKRYRNQSTVSEADDKSKRLKGDAVTLLLTTLHSESWRSALSSCLESSAFARLADFVGKERKSHTIYPSAKDTWTALNSCCLNDVKVVIVGQDPYHGVNQAHGLCFSVLPGERPPPSLKNVYKELSQDPEVSFITPDHGYLLSWAEQGVLLLNTVLTVRKGQANSHKKRGWEDVTDRIIRCVDERPGKRCVFLLWGKPATTKALQLIGPSSSKHTIICTSHPSPLGATKTKSPFLGSRCFSRCNRALIEMEEAPIDWNL